VPSQACLLQRALGASCPAYDINAACSGFIYALDIADGLIKSSKYDKILIVCADQLSKFVDYSDRSTCVLFGDGAGAAVLEKGDSLKYIKLTAKGDKEHLSIPATFPKSPFSVGSGHRNYLYMNGKEIFKFAVSTIVDSAKEAARRLNISIDDIDYFYLHQANGRILEMAQSQLKQPPQKFPVNYSEYGNTSAASIPLLLDIENKKGALKKGDIVFFGAFGGGLTSGVCIIEW
jgi:3-oxoacyl-[acyl-carrier-protein] synthase-3